MASSPVLAGQSSTNINCLDLVGLPQLMARTSGRAEIAIGLIDGPVALDHSDLAGENIRQVPGKMPAACADAGNAACTHGTFIAGILHARRMSAASFAQPRHFAVKIAVRVGYGPIALGAEPIEETRETGIQPRSNRSPTRSE